MTPECADKICAEFEGWQCIAIDKAVCPTTVWGYPPKFKNGNKEPIPRYSEDLNLLVPVWEKLDVQMIMPFSITLYREYSKIYLAGFNEKNCLNNYMDDEKSDTIQAAAAIATAKAIQALGGGE